MLRPWEIQFKVNFKDGKAIYLQIADTIIAAVKQGKLQTGDTLPGSRKLAAQINVNRNTVVKALEVLFAEGWLETKARKGVFIAEIGKQYKPGRKVKVIPENKVKESKKERAKIIFDDGLPDSRNAPIKELARAYRQIFNRKARWQMMGYGDPQGDLAFRQSMVKMLNHKRGMGLNTNNLCITRGSQMALYLTSMCLLRKDDIVAIENPGYKPAWEAFVRAGAKLLPLDMEADGLDIKKLKSHLRKGDKIKAIYTTPHHHFPTTISLSLQKRIELIELSNEYGFTIIEDDYDHEFHFGHRPLLPIGSLLPVKNHVYIGTLSKIVSPALRIGYVATNTELINDIVDLRKLIDVQGDNIMEQAVLELINDGSIKKHLTRATLMYEKKKDTFDDIINKYIQHKVTYHKPDGGLAFWLVPNKKVDLNNVGKQLLADGIQILTPVDFSYGAPVMGLRLGYASVNETQLEEGIIAIGKYL